MRLSHLLIAGATAVSFSATAADEQKSQQQPQAPGDGPAAGREGRVAELVTEGQRTEQTRTERGGRQRQQARPACQQLRYGRSAGAGRQDGGQPGEDQNGRHDQGGCPDAQEAP